MNKAALRELRERVEKATGPDREIDALLEVETTPIVASDDDLIYLLPIHRDDHCKAGTYWRKARSGASLHTAPLYTASVDAALALVERCLPNWTDASNATAPECGIDWDLFEPVRYGRRVKGTGKTRPLAILAALLSALEAQADDAAGEWPSASAGAG